MFLNFRRKKAFAESYFQIQTSCISLALCSFDFTQDFDGVAL